MFQTKKAKIRQYLQGLSVHTAFDELPEDYLSGTLRGRLTDLGMARIEIHIDWLPGIRCIGIRGCCGAYWLNIQIDPDEYRFAADEDEPDEDVTVPLVTAEAFYTDIHKKLAEIQEETI